MRFIEVKNLSLEKDGREILSDISLTIEEGDRIGIIGRSGAGKSALLQSIRGVREYAPTEGKIFYNVKVCEECLYVNPPSYEGECPACGGWMEFKRIDFWSPEGLKYHNTMKRRFGMMFQEATGLYSMRSVLENVMEALRAGGCPEEKRKARALEILESVSLLHRVRHIARDLSGGEKQRLVLARQIAKDPPLLLLDEPTGTLDPGSSKKIYDILEDFSNGRTILIASHLTSFIPKVAPSSVLLSKGRIILDGPTEEVIKKFIELESRNIEIEKGKWVREERPIITCKNIKKQYHTVDEGYITALDGINLTIYEGEIHGIIGRTGAGKTTLVNIIAGNMDKYEGSCRVRVNDEEVEMKDRGPEYRGKAKEMEGVLHQEFGFATYYTIYRNIRGSIPDMPDEIAEEEIREVMRIIGFSEEEVESLLRKYPDEISEGEKQRILLATVLLRQPRIVILDEPTGTLDVGTMMDVSESIIRARNELSTTFIIVSHDLEFLKTVCDRITVMDAGKVLYTGEPGEAIDFALDKGLL
ncbi:MAG: methyl coenzyme M reductase system, component A2 [Candidatus Methanospirareceae archaeon]